MELVTSNWQDIFHIGSIGLVYLPTNLPCKSTECRSYLYKHTVYSIYIYARLYLFNILLHTRTRAIFRTEYHLFHPYNGSFVRV